MDSRTSIQLAAFAVVLASCSANLSGLVGSKGPPGSSVPEGSHLPSVTPETEPADKPHPALAALMPQLEQADSLTPTAHIHGLHESALMAESACRKAVANATQEGLPAKAILQVNQRSVSFNDADQAVCIALGDVVRGVQKGDADKQQAKLAPFLEALSEDKRKIYLQLGVHLDFQGKDGILLKRPAQLAKARKWFTTTGRYEARADTHHWAVNVYVFKGDKLARKDRREGIGKNPPRSAYR